MKICAVIVLAFLSASAFAATEYFVATDGSSGNTGLSTNSPWPLQYALDRLNPGITITLMPGVYTGGGYYAIDGTGGNMSGTPSNPATIRSQYKWKAVLANSTNEGFIIFRCTNVVVDGLCVSNSAKDAVTVSGAFNTIKNCWIVDNGQIGFQESAAGNSNIVLESSLIELSGHGVWDGTNGHRWHATYLVGPNLIIRNNVVRHNAGQGIAFGTASIGPFMNNCQMYNNLTYGHTNFTGMAMEGASQEYPTLTPGTNYVFGNTILDGLFLAYGTACVTNNIILPGVPYPTKPITVYVSSPQTIRQDYNLTTMALVNPDDIGGNMTLLSGTHGIITNYLGFVNTNNGLYWLKANSPARNNAKTTVLSPTNFFGIAQSSVSDIGAFQYDTRLASDTRRLDPSPRLGAAYWSPWGSLTSSNSRITTLRIAP